MTEVKLSSHYDISPDQVWELIGKFHALPDWHPAVEKSELEEGGTHRRLSLAGGGEILEKLEQSDDDDREYVYSILSSPLPIANYTAKLKVVPDGDGAKVEWSSSFDPLGSENDAVKAIEGVYQAGLDNLKKIFGG